MHMHINATNALHGNFQYISNFGPLNFMCPNIFFYYNEMYISATTLCPKNVSTFYIALDVYGLAW